MHFLVRHGYAGVELTKYSQGQYISVHLDGLVSVNKKYLGVIQRDTLKDDLRASRVVSTCLLENGAAFRKHDGDSWFFMPEGDRLMGAYDGVGVYIVVDKDEPFIWSHEIGLKEYNTVDPQADNRPSKAPVVSLVDRLK